MVGQSVQARLHRGSDDPVVDTPGRLMQHPDQRQLRPFDAQPRSDERGGDAVEDDGFRSEPVGPLKRRPCLQRR
jgi:hypothetical protein